MDFSFPNVDGVASALTTMQSNRASMSTAAISRGTNNLQDGRYAAALDDFRRAIAYDPRSTTALRLMANTYVLLGRTDEAVASYKKALDVDPTFVDARNELANLYMKNERWGDAEEQFKQVLRTDAGAAGAVASLGYIAMQGGRLAEAEARFRQAARLAPNDAAAHYSLGLVAARMGRHEEAITEYDTAIRMRPTYAAAYADKAYSLIELDQTELAKSQVDSLFELKTTESVTLGLEVGRAISRPKIAFFDSTRSTFNPLLGPQTPVSTLDSRLATPGAVVTLSMTFEFNGDMDAASVQNPYNWMISRATGGEAGTYNNGMTTQADRQIAILPIPIGVTYDAANHRATVYFRVSQNAAGNGLMDPSRWVFRFSGVDADGRAMDPHGDEFAWGARRSF